MQKKIIASTIAALLTISPAFVSTSANATGVVAGATEFTQIANNVELIAEVAQQAQQLATEINHYNLMIKNMAVLPNQVFGPIAADLTALQNVVKTGQALSFANANIATQFQNTYPGYKPSTNFSQDYQNWSKTTMASINGTLQANNLSMNQFATEQATMQQLQGMSQSSTGALQALQVGAQIANEQVNQLQKLRQTMMQQSQAQTAYLAGQQQVSDSTNAAVNAALTYKDPRTGVTFQSFQGGSK